MVRIRPCAILHADFLDDQIEDDHDIIQFGGHGVTEAIAQIIRSLGYPASEPQHEGEHGWTFEIRDKGRYVWFQITDFGDSEFLLISRQTYFYDKNGGKPTPVYAEVLSRLNLALSRDPRFHDVLWYLNSELYEGFPGESAPVATDGGGEASSKVVIVQRLLDLILSRRKLVHVRPWAEFRADFMPEAIKAAGWEVMTAIGEFLDKPDCKMAGLSLIKDKGWHMIAWVRGQAIRLYLTPLAERQFRLFCEPPSWVRRHFSDDYEVYVRIVAQVNLAMQGNPNFHDIRWYAHPARRSGDSGAAKPVDES